jgi:hypothetical protein
LSSRDDSVQDRLREPERALVHSSLLITTMVKASSKHGLERKFKPWRKGKSQHANKRSSLKSQLRGFQRLLGKLEKDETNSEDVQKRRQELQEKIRAQELEIAGKQQNIQERKNAQKSHGVRFLDRQKLVRMERKLRSEQEKSGTDTNSLEQQLYKIALDQVYVAHHPTDVKYMPLFQKGERVVDHSRQLYRRAMTRKRILRDLFSPISNEETEKKWEAEAKKSTSWIGHDQYLRLTREWSIQDEEKVFGGSITRKGLSAGKDKGLVATTDDSRFSVASTHDALLQAADHIESQLDQEMELLEGKEETEVKGDEDDSSSESEDDDNENDYDHVKIPSVKTKKYVEAMNLEEESESTDDEQVDNEEEDYTDPLQDNRKRSTSRLASSGGSEDSSDSSDDEEPSKKAVLVKSKDSEKKSVAAKSSSDDSSSSSSSSNSSSSSSSDDSSSDEKEDRVTPITKDKSKKPKALVSNPSSVQDNEEEFDDFLVEAADDAAAKNAFESARNHIPALDEARGDKSRGWETQRQRPGAFKKKRVRR